MNEHQLPLYRLIVEIRGAFNDLKALSDSMNADIEVTAAMRAVLEQLERAGAQTVPQIASARNVSRQHIQLLADALAEKGLAQFQDNPDHKRSKLMAMTPAGFEMFDTIREREADTLRRLSGHFKDAELETAVSLIARLREEIAQEDP